MALVDKADDAVARSTAIDKRNNRHREASTSVPHESVRQQLEEPPFSLSVSSLGLSCPLQGAPKGDGYKAGGDTGGDTGGDCYGRVCSHPDVHGL
jgi:hypothetical protein